MGASFIFLTIFVVGLQFLSYSTGSFEFNYTTVQNLANKLQYNKCPYKRIVRGPSPLSFELLLSNMTDRIRILGVFNTFRNAVARGQFKNMPAASLMSVLYWSYELEKKLLNSPTKYPDKTDFACYSNTLEFSYYIGKKFLGTTISDIITEVKSIVQSPDKSGEIGNKYCGILSYKANRLACVVRKYDTEHEFNGHYEMRCALIVRKDTGITSANLIEHGKLYIKGEPCKNCRVEWDKQCNEEYLGLCGNSGEKGDVGMKGDKGFKGVRGDRVLGFKGNNGGQGMQGQKGEKGNKGVTGIKGEKGDRGFQGDSGPLIRGMPGETGPKGLQGPQGDQGEKGPVGPRGPTRYNELIDHKTNIIYVAINGSLLLMFILSFILVLRK